MKLEPRDLDDAIVESPLTNLDLVPADIRLARLEMQPDYLAHRLTKQIREHACGYDLVFIDCPPQLGKLLTAALYSAHYVLVPCAADAMGLQGLADLAYTIEQVRKNVNSDLGMLGAVINLYKPQRNLFPPNPERPLKAAIALVSHVFDTNCTIIPKSLKHLHKSWPAVMYAEKHRRQISSGA